MRLRRVAVVAVAASALLLAGCSGSPSGGGTTTLKFFSWDGETTMKPVIAKFEAAHPDIHVEFSSAPPVDQYVQTLQTRISSNTAADVFMMVAENKTQLIKGGFAEDLSDKPYMKHLNAANVAAYTTEGSTYGMSVSSWGGGAFYDKKLTEAAGITTPPKTWDEFIADLEKVKGTGVTPFYDPDDVPMSLTALIGAQVQGKSAADAAIFDGSSSFKKTWTEPLQQWDKLLQNGLISKDVVGLTYDQMLDEFVNGRVAMFASGPWNISTIRKSAPDMEVGYFPFPAPKGQETVLTGAPSPAYAINAKTQHQKQADTFLSWLASPAGTAAYNKSAAAITTTDDYEPKVDPALDSVVPAIREGKIYLAQLNWPRSSDVLFSEAHARVQEMILGKSTPEQVAEAMDKKLAEADK
jgi:raffinose/stachyose/melibiose transport system substrate-binding protein